MFYRRASVTFFHSRRSISQLVQKTSRQVYVEMHSGHTGLAVLTLNRPEAKNALGRQMLSELQECLSELERSILEAESRVVIVKSAADRVFCAGADLKERRTMSQGETSRFVSSLRSTFSQLEKLQAPTIAALDGAALGGGLELALCCDLRVASNDLAVLGLPETKLAIIPGAGGTQRLPRLVGLSKAKELIFTGRRITALEALSTNLCNFAVDSDAYSKAVAVAAEILPQGPVALRMAKKAISEGISHDLNTGLAVEELCYAQVIPTEDRLEGLKAFQEKRTPVYRGK